MKKIKSILVILVSIAIVSGIAYAGSLTSPSTISSQSYTLSDIYNKMMNITYSPIAHTVSTTTPPAPSFRTLTEIYNKLNTEGGLITPDNIRDGVTIFGVTGNYTGSGGSGGILSWTGTIPSVSLISVGVYNYQPGFGPQHGLCWSHGQRETTWGCTTGASGGFYNASQGGASIPLGASEYCDYLNSDGVTVATSPVHYWRLPTQSELYLKMTEAIFNGADDPVSVSRGGFRNANYLTSEYNPTNSYINTPVGTYDSVKTVVFLYSSDRKYGSPHLAVREAHSVFRCVHAN